MTNVSTTGLHSRAALLRQRAIASALALALPVIAHAHRAPAHRPATTLEVSNCDDSGAGSLRDVVAGANEGDTVDLSQLTCSAITLTGAIEIPQDDLSIKYSGEGGTRPTISAGLSSRVFHHTGAGQLRLIGLDIADGKYDNDAGMTPSLAAGGCVYSAGSLYLLGSTLTDCAAKDEHGRGAAGGAVYARNGLQISYSTLSGNSANSYGSGGDGGGAFTHGALSVDASTISGNEAVGTLVGIGGGLAVVNAGGGVSTIANTTISGNVADRGGGLMVSGVATYGAAVSIANSTITGNNANGYAAAAYLDGPVTIVASTIAFNTSQESCAVELVSAAYPVSIESSIVAENSNGSFDYGIGSRGYAITIAGSHDIIIEAAPGIVLPGDTIAADPLLLPLADNGGQTETLALGDGSPAIDAGDNAEDASFDQRGDGFARVVGASADIGAFERQGPDDTIFANGFDAAMGARP